MRAITLRPEIHRQRRFRIHALAPDFALLDCWRMPIQADPARGEDLRRFLEVFIANGFDTGNRAADALFQLRGALGRWLHLDDGPALAIPGCTERSLRDRLTADDRAADRSPTFTMPASNAPLTLVYLLEDEALLETSNQTVHALLHLGWVDGEGGKTCELAIYIKPRGLAGSAYMALIKPFRHLVVYPAWLPHLGRRWESARITPRAAPQAPRRASPR